MQSWFLRRRIPTVVFLSLGLGACGQMQENTQMQSESLRATTLTFPEWCAQWQLSCDADSGSIDAPTPAQWNAANSLIHSYVTSSSQFAVSREELSDAHLKAALKFLRVEDLYDRVQTRVRETDWKSLTLSAGTVTSKAGLAITDKANSGLSYHWGATEQTSWDAKGVITFSGLSISGPANAPVALQSLSMAANGSMTVNMPAQTVTGVPFKTIVNSLLDATGVDLEAIKAKDIKTQEVVQAASPLMLWLNRPGRVIDLNQAFFTKAADQAGALLPQDETGNSLKLLVGTLASLKTSTAASANLATVTASSGLKCDWDNGEVKIVLAKEFGVKRSYQVNENSYGIEFYGLQISGRKSLGLTINVKRIETDKDKLIIQDVPVIGKVELKWDDVLKSGENAQLLCSKA